MPATAKAAETLSVLADQLHERAAQAPGPTSPSRDEAHAPGPWTLARHDGYSIVIGLDAYGDRMEIATLYNTHPQDGGTLEEWHPRQAANARLIAAAPDLLAALKPFAALIETYKAALESDGVAHWVDFLQQVAWPSEADCLAAKAAIAKATGAAS